MSISVGMLTVLGSAPAIAGTTSSTAIQAEQSRRAADADKAVGVGRYADAAGLYESLANQLAGPPRDHALLKAARSYQQSGNDAKAMALLAQVSKTLGTTDQTLKILIQGAHELRSNQAVQALSTLDQIPLPLPEELAADIMGVRAQAQFAIGRTVVALNTALERERVLKSEAELTQNRQAIWVGLRQAAATGRDLTPPSGASRVAAGWLELGRLVNGASTDPFAYSRSVTDWRTRYPGHPGEAFLPVSAPLPITRTNTIALLLPLSGKQQAAGQAVRDGFLAAMLQSGAGHPAVQIYDTNELTALGAYQRASEAGAEIVVGPLLREDVDSLAQTSQIGTVTLALNNVSEGIHAPALMFQFGLNPETEARQAAQRAHADGLTRAIALFPNNEWGQRMQKAFVAQLQSQGDKLVDARSYDPAARDYVNFIKQAFNARKPVQTKALEQALGRRQVAETRDDYDYVFIAAQTAQAKQLRPALRFVLPDNSAPVYTTSDSLDPEEATHADLDATHIADMPWAVNRDGDTQLLHDSLSKLWGAQLRSRSRLYAFGIDAWRLSHWLRNNQASFGNTLRGVTGLLALDTSGQIQRQLDWAKITNGKPQIISSTP